MELNRVNLVHRLVPVRHVIISVADKSGLPEFVRALVRLAPDVRIYSTGGTARLVAEVLGEASSHHLVPISSYTGQPEMQGGLVKTLDFKIYMGLLSETYNEEHRKDMARTGAVPFDMVVVNLYPFEKAVSEAGATLEDGRTHIDIGGPCMLRAAAKNFLRVAAVSDPSQYGRVLEDLEVNTGATSYELRLSLAREVFARTSAYDRAIARFLEHVPATFEDSPYEEPEA
ncbi:phosphoribosylaminoimidazolecarboxamide formyltransferase [Spirochaeta thermophila]|uniref:Phosphoribosylaminoimidazolecarboxamideformyltra nsferase n=1 Tax=Winmispira thermophila (strain ATCC 49972 / DSM 6192 / RI 19.B1) TaxID=665571 RepID=E0RSF3_WINT6|nr:phosphoribosylaminoimidazolecarboxamide formyltransferase [Spirochaeta thermophila]ADN01940.1 phosphoribosylaminoimidazolecarboxamideformyltransferase [Spirochaeta thermophila DSM 6192]